MTKEDFIALHGEEAFNILAADKFQRAKLYEHGVDILQKIHNETIMPVLRLLGFPDATGLLKVKILNLIDKNLVNILKEQEKRKKNPL